MDFSKLTKNELLLLKELKVAYDSAQEMSSIEQAYKTILNSLYGAISNINFAHYNLDIATAITLTGQNYIRTVIEVINNEFKDRFFNGEFKDCVPGADTDSSMIDINHIVESYFKGDLNDTHAVADWIIELDDQYLAPLITKTNNDVSTYLNAYRPDMMYMKREVVSDNSLFIAKKRYTMNMIDKEGVRYTNGKLKIQGLEIVRSNTSNAVKDYLKDAIPIIFKGSEKDVRDYCYDVERKFKELDIVSIATPSGVNGIDRYSDDTTIYKKGTPKHTRSAILYNHLLYKNNLDKTIEPINNGDKIKYIPLITPNPIVGMENVLAFQGDSVPEFLLNDYNLMQYVDMDELFDKSFKQPLTNLIAPLNYNIENEISFSDLF